jgi:acyl-coenzyme A thioesterase PaaI-like protein
VEVTYDGRCFGCGQDNAEGLRLRFEDRDGLAVAEYTVPDRYQSWGGMTHGGMVALMLDEAVGWAAWNAGHPGVTGKLEVRYRHPLLIGSSVTICGRVERVRRSLVEAVAWIDRGEARPIAEASAVLMEVPVRVAAGGRAGG